VYSPCSRVSEKLPVRPSAARFSFSPRIVSPWSTSNSLTADVPAFSTSKTIGPAGALASCGSQPASVSSNDIFVAPAGVSSLEPQPESARRTRIAVGRRSRVIVRAP
jgi:hypothetical protein